jgi:hypothetical protein
MSAMQRAVTGLYAQRGTPSHVTGTRKDSSTAVCATEALRGAVNHRLKSVVRDIRTLRSVGAGGG